MNVCTLMLKTVKCIFMLSAEKWNELDVSVISGFCGNIDEICALLQYCAASNGNPGPMFWDNISPPSSRVDFLTLEDGTDPLSRNTGKGSPLDTA
jgi:hypothetical protein